MIKKLKNFTTINKLFILLLVFLITFLGQFILNSAYQKYLDRLEKNIQNGQVETLLAQHIILDINELRAHFYQLLTFPNHYLTQILLKKINEEQQEIKGYFKILNKGGHFTVTTELNNFKNKQITQKYFFTPFKQNNFKFLEIDTLLKLKEINKKVRFINQNLNEILFLKNIQSPLLAQKIDQLRLQERFSDPIFVRLKENANQLFFEDQKNIQFIKHTFESKRKFFQLIQWIIIAIALLIGLYFFWRLSKDIYSSEKNMKKNSSYIHDILNSQNNIIVVNDGKKILDVSGGFYQFFKEFDSLEAFSAQYSCICDLFVEEEGYIYKFKEIKWIDYILQNKNQVHKAKINYLGQETIFQISITQSQKYQRFIISMFDITENENYQKALEEEKNKALAATQAKGDFLANMSHEIRTPLNAILGFIHLLKERTIDSESRNYLNIIDTSSQSLLGIINDILDFSKIESGKMDLDPIDFDPKKEFNSVADLFRARCSEKNLNFIIECSEKLPKGLNTDILRIKQVVSNLLSNAVKFTPKGKTVSLQISYQKGFLSCAVRDEGIGMSEEAQKHIFEAFTQAESSTTRKFGGTGLGLAISYNLVSLLGGQLKVASTLGKGSHFYFSIPVEEVDIKDISEATVEMNQTFKGHLLLVEDNKTNQLLMSAILKKQGVTFDIANDGLEAIKMIKDQQYDLVLMDENMPNLNGIEATKRIREWEMEANIVPHIIIALTANAMTGDRERFIQAGMNEYLPKPIQIPMLIEIFNLYLNRDL